MADSENKKKMLKNRIDKFNIQIANYQSRINELNKAKTELQNKINKL